MRGQEKGLAWGRSLLNKGNSSKGALRARKVRCVLGKKKKKGGVRTLGGGRRGEKRGPQRLREEKNSLTSREEKKNHTVRGKDKKRFTSPRRNSTDPKHPGRAKKGKRVSKEKKGNIKGKDDWRAGDQRQRGKNGFPKK